MRKKPLCGKCQFGQGGDCILDSDQTVSVECFEYKPFLPIRKCEQCGIRTRDWDDAYKNTLLCRKCLIGPDEQPPHTPWTDSPIAQMEEHGDESFGWQKMNRYLSKKMREKGIPMDLWKGGVGRICGR